MEDDMPEIDDFVDSRTASDLEICDCIVYGGDRYIIMCHYIDPDGSIHMAIVPESINETNITTYMVCSSKEVFRTWRPKEKPFKQRIVLL